MLLLLLLCANDIERNPGPDPDVDTLLQGLFTQQEVKFQTSFGQRLEKRFQSLSHCAKMDSAFSAIENQVQILQTKTTRLEENYYDMFQEAQTSSSLMILEEKLSQTTTMLRFFFFFFFLDKLEGFSRRDNLEFFNIPQWAAEDYETCVTKVVSILQDTVPNRQWCRADIVRAHRLGSNTSDKSRNGFSKP